MTDQNTQSLCCAERREHPRKPFKSTQLIAPFRDGWPTENENFFQVNCHDLTPKGFSFFVDQEPDFEELVVAFQMSSERVLVHAEVRNVRQVLFFSDSGRMEECDGTAAEAEPCENRTGPSPQETGTPMTLVGCRFTGRRRPRLEAGLADLAEM